MGKRSFFKAFSRVAPLALLAVAVGCGGNSGGGGGSTNGESGSSPSPEPGGNTEQVTVRFANFSAAGDNEQYLNQMKQEFERQNPDIKVEIETIGYNDYFTQMQTRVASGAAPDAYELNYENFVSYAKKGVLKPLDELFASSGFDESLLNPMALNAFNTDGSQYGLPASFSNVIMFYNKELFDQAEVDYPTNDWTWTELNDAAQKIRDLDSNIFGIYQPVTFNEFFKSVQQNGGSLLNEDLTEFTLNTPENVETLSHLAGRIVDSNVMPNDAQLSGMGDWDLFKSGRLGILMTGIWAFTDFAENITFDWDVAVEPGNTAKATHFFSNGFVINQDSDVSEAAFEWIKFVSSSKEAATIRVDAGWELPAITDESILEAYLSKTPPENRQAVFDSLDHLVTPPVIEQYSEMSDIVNLHLQSAAQGAKTAEQALSDAQAELEQRVRLGN